MNKMIKGRSIWINNEWVDGMNIDEMNRWILFFSHRLSKFDSASWLQLIWFKMKFKLRIELPLKGNEHQRWNWLDGESNSSHMLRHLEQRKEKEIWLTEGFTLNLVFSSRFASFFLFIIFNHPWKWSKALQDNLTVFANWNIAANHKDSCRPRSLIMLCNDMKGFFQVKEPSTRQARSGNVTSWGCWSRWQIFWKKLTDSLLTWILPVYCFTFLCFLKLFVSSGFQVLNQVVHFKGFTTRERARKEWGRAFIWKQQLDVCLSVSSSSTLETCWESFTWKGSTWKFLMSLKMETKVKIAQTEVWNTL